MNLIRLDAVGIYGSIKNLLNAKGGVEIASIPK